MVLIQSSQEHEIPLAETARAAFADNDQPLLRTRDISTGS